MGTTCFPRRTPGKCPGKVPQKASPGKESPAKAPDNANVGPPERGSPERVYGNGSRKGFLEGNQERFPERVSRKGLIMLLIIGTLRNQLQSIGKASEILGN